MRSGPCTLSRLANWALQLHSANGEIFVFDHRLEGVPLLRMVC